MFLISLTENRYKWFDGDQTKASLFSASLNHRLISTAVNTALHAMALNSHASGEKVKGQRASTEK